MDSFKLKFSPKPCQNKISHGQSLLFLGSCFSDEISLKAKYYGFKSDSNPFGTIYHPLAISDFIQKSLVKNENERIFRRNDLFLSWDSGSIMYGISELELRKKLLLLREDWSQKLRQANFLFVTFGTAWAYQIANTGELVANCHKMPGDIFNKELIVQKEILDSWKVSLALLKDANPKLNIVFTVSPVRHVRDGLIENNRSKAVLIDCVRELEIESKCFYFPSYEIVMDELRDYRFYKIDRVHPNEEAINYVWDRFSDVFFTEETIKLNKEIAKLRMAELHRNLYPESLEAVKNVQRNLENQREFLKVNPNVILNKIF